ncbi:MAG TPA: FAD-dependent monooxygenase [Candidatus Binatia bacterium]|nr:FAD-dependent monooxygenase [Candidatus Binatia bacterium]
MPFDSPDVLIAGAGPAGTALALHLSRIAPAVAARTWIVEKQIHPRHKVCAGGLIPHTLDCLRELSIELTVPHVLVHRATARIPRGEVRYSDRVLCAVVRRREFDALLAEHATRVGVELRQDEKVLEVLRDGGAIRVLTDRGEIRPRVLVGADGSGSVVRRQLFGAERETIGRAVMCDLRAADVGDFDAERYVFDFRAVPRGLKGYLWEFPCRIGGELHVNLGAYARDRGGGVSLPSLVRRRARELGVESPRLEAFPIRWYTRRSAIGAPGVLLVGDAAGCDPLMGEGISYAFEYARLAAGEIARGFGTGRFDFTPYGAAVARSWFGRKLHRLGGVAGLFYGRGARLGFALAARSRRLQDVGIRWYNGIDGWDRISGWSALARLLSGAT